LDHVVRYYNAGETYFSRAFTLLGLGGILVSGILGASQVPAVRSEFAKATDLLNPASPASLNSGNGNSPGNGSASQIPATATLGLSTHVERISRPLKAAPASPQVASPRSPASPAQAVQEGFTRVEREIEQEIQSVPIAPPTAQQIQQKINEVEQEVEQVVPESLPIPVPDLVPDLPSDLSSDLPFSGDNDDASEDGDEDS
jgi:hypothetical protein